MAALKRVQANLKRYRASVLQAACEGRLVPTEAELARAEGRDYETGSVLLEQVAEMRLESRRPQPAKGAKEHAPSKASGPAVLPEGWAWSSLKCIAELKGGITKGQKSNRRVATRLVPYLRVANVQRGYLDLSEIKTIEATEEEIEAMRLLPDDVLFNEGGDRDKLGRGWVWDAQIAECIHQNHVFRARVFSTKIHPKFLSWYANTIGQGYFWDEGKHTTNLASINLTKLGGLPVPIPPYAEQSRIVAEAERRISLTDAAVLIVDANLKRAERLRQSILKRAFEGKLAPQDPTDEPASVLLERIAAETSNAVGSGSPRAPGARMTRGGKATRRVYQPPILDL